jgi:PAS domain S-box-containing protein
VLIGAFRVIGVTSPLRHHPPKPRSFDAASGPGGRPATAAPRDIERTVAARPVGRVIRRAFLATVAAAGAVVLLASIRDLMRQPVESTWFVLVGLTLVTGWGTLRMRNVPVSFSISDTFTIAAALLYGPAAGTVIVALDALVMSLRVAHETTAGMRERVLFNATATALAMWLAAHVFYALTGAGPLASEPGTIREVIGPLATFAGVYFILNTGLIAVAVADERRASVAAVWRSHFSTLWLTYFGGAAIAAVLVLMTVARVIDVRTLALIWPLLFILHVTYKAAIDRVQEQVAHLTQIASYAAALRGTADAVLVVDGNGRVTLINPAAERLTGWTEREASGRLGTDVFRALDPATREHDGGAPRADGGTVREYILVRPDGVECPIEELQARIHDHRGEIVGMIKTFRDVSRRKAIDAEREALLESERAARAAADAVNRLKDEFLATLSHELRTPATGILGWVRLLKSGRMDEAHTRHALEALERSARAQAVLLDDLVDMSGIAQGTVRLDLRPTDLQEPLNSAIEAVEPAIRSKAIDFRLDVPAGLPLLHADTDRLRRVLWNLLSNAVKFTDPGGSIRVSVTWEVDHVRIDIIDSGRGIDPESLPFIFDRFRQADGSTTRSHGGLGLGLAIVRHLVESHGGTVTAASEGPGRGALFRIRLPNLIVPREVRELGAAS